MKLLIRLDLEKTYSFKRWGLGKTHVGSHWLNGYLYTWSCHVQPIFQQPKVLTTNFDFSSKYY